MFRRTYKRRGQSRGGILLTVMVVLVLITVMGVGMLKTSQLGIRQSGYYRAQQSLETFADTGLEVAHLRLTNIALDTDDGPTRLRPSDLIGMCTPSTGGSVCTSPNPSCPLDIHGDTNKSVITENVICNLMGSKFPNGRVILVRQDDAIVATETYAVFLLNVVGYDAANRKLVLQATETMRYLPSVLPAPTPVAVASRRWVTHQSF